MNNKLEEKYVLLGKHLFILFGDGIGRVPAARVAKDIGLFADVHSDRVGAIALLVDTFYRETLQVKDGDVELQHGKSLRDLKAAVEEVKKRR